MKQKYLSTFFLILKFVVKYFVALITYHAQSVNNESILVAFHHSEHLNSATLHKSRRCTLQPSSSDRRKTFQETTIARSMKSSN